MCVEKRRNAVASFFVWRGKTPLSSVKIGKITNNKTPYNPQKTTTKQKQNIKTN